MLHQKSKYDTFQEFDKDPQQAQVSHPPKENNEHLGKAYVVEALEPTHIFMYVSSLKTLSIFL